MITIILAAGKGSRLSLDKKSKFSYSIPFLFLNINLPPLELDLKDEYLVENIIKNLKSLDNHFLFVLGYRFFHATPILAYLSQKYGAKIDYIVNPDFETTNTAYSLFLAIKAIISNDYLDDILILNGDLYLSSKLWTTIRKFINKKQNFLVIDITKTLDEESFKIQIKNNTILNMGKNLAIDKSQGEFIGVSYIKKSSLISFYKILKNVVFSDKKEYYDISFIEFSQIEELNFLKIEEKNLWTEIDFKKDLYKLHEIIKKENN